jgi:hypothetical protein
MIESVDVNSYQIRYRDFDIRRDIHSFVNYVSSREVKRKTHGNDLAKSDVKRLSKVLSYNHIMDEYEQWGLSSWVYFVDQLALSLEFTNYDIKGKYRGYSSSEPSFTNNYIEYKSEVYDLFLSLSLSEQENHLLRLLVTPYNHTNNEFFGLSPVGWLEHFPSWGSAVGTLPLINFAEVRDFLFYQLKDMETGIWYSTASWIQQLKKEYPYFLIPKESKRKKRGFYYGKKKQAPEYEVIPRYGTFYESHQHNSRDDNIPDDAKDGFERVEGRYIERFLEYIPFLMGYVDLAYDPDIEKTTQRFSSDNQQILRDVVKAFRINPLLKQSLENLLPSPTVTVQPNFEVVIESPIYPATFIKTLSDFGKVTHQDKTTTVLLDKQSIAAAVANDESLDIIQILTAHSERALPQNIIIELKEWAQHADVFTVYEGVQLVEDQIGLDTVRNHAMYTIQDGLYLISDTVPITQHLQQQDQIVIHSDHLFEELTILPKGTISQFPSQDNQEEEKIAENIIVQQEHYITLHFPRRDVLDMIRQGLLDKRCPVTFNADANTLTFSRRFQTQLENVIQSLTDTYIIHIQEMS